MFGINCSLYIRLVLINNFTLESMLKINFLVYVDLRAIDKKKFIYHQSLLYSFSKKIRVNMMFDV